MNNYDNIFTSNFGINKEQGIRHMKKIAELGGTKEMFEIQVPEEIDNAFKRIADAITPKYGLKIK